MIRKFFLCAVLFVFMFLTSGCITVNTEGCCPDKSQGKCNKKVAKADAGEKTNPIKVADEWVKKNLW